MANPFSPATKKRAKLRLALMGASGSGKTFSALGIASAFGKVAVIDTEHGSASKYADRFAFDTLELTNYHPQRYIEALEAAAAAGYDVVVVDSLSHAWNGIGGVLEIVDKVAAKSDAKNTYTAWRDATPLQQKLVEAMLTVPLHVIVTMRSKTEYVLELDKRGKMSPRKVGTAPVQRDGIEFEFDVVGEMNADNELVVTKTRISTLANEVIPQPGQALGMSLRAWLEDGAEAPQKPSKDAEPTQRQQAPQNGAGGVQKPPLANTPPTDTTAKVDGGSSAGAEFFPPEAVVLPLHTEGDSDHLPHDVNGLPYTDFLCHELVYTVTNGGSQYTFKSEHGANIVVFGSEWVLNLVDYADRDAFKNTPGKVQRLMPPMVVTARFDNKAKKWDVEQITTLETVGK